MASNYVLQNDFEAAVRSFNDFGVPTICLEEKGLRYFINEFWTAGQRQAHALHEISYRACFKPQLPGFFIDRLTKEGDSVYDPFMGRGTTPLQAALQSRRPMGNDVNPLSLLLTRPRLAPPSLDEIEERLADVDWSSGEIERDDLLAFYHPDTLRQICALRRHLMRHALGGAVVEPVLDWIRMIAINRLTGHSPGFFSVYSLPPNQAVSVEAQRKINAKRRQTPPLRPVAQLILKKSRALLSEGAPPPHPAPLLTTGPAWRAPAIADAAVDLIVTSPPFLDVVQYAQDNWLRNWFAGLEAATMEISAHRSIEAWTQMVRDCFNAFARILRPGGHVAFEVGEVRQGAVLLEQQVWKAVEGLPFDRLFVLVNRQKFTKTSNCWGVDNNHKGTNTNRIVVLRRR